MKIGAQFFTVREHCKTPDDFAESLKKVADIGYSIVQISGVCPYEPEWLKRELDKNGLTCVLTHIPSDRLVADPVLVAKEHDVFGCDHVGLGCYHFDETKGETVETFVSTYSPVAKAIESQGKTFMYHNHAYEFDKREDRLILDQIVEKIPEMGITLDTYWVQVGGGDPARWIEQLNGRVPCIHLEDCAYQQKMAVVGEGNINFDRVFQMAENAGTKYMLVEQDNCYGEDPFDCLKRSYAYLKSRGFE